MASIDLAPNSGERTGNRTVLRYIIQGVSSQSQAWSMLTSIAPSTCNGQPRKDSEISLDPDFINSSAGVGVWKAEVPYEPAEDDTDEITLNQWTWSYNSVSGSQHVIQSRQTVSSYAPSGETAPNFKGLIGVTDSGAEGVDIGTRAMGMTGKYYLAESAMTGTYIVSLFQLLKRTNNATWTASVNGVGVQFDAGEVLFEGFSVTQRDDGIWEVTAEISCSPNVTGQVVGDITGIARKGWEYLWVYYQPYEETTGAKALVQRPVAAYVEKLYEDGDFGNLILT